MAPQTIPKSSTRNPILDGWRGIAILLVLINHLHPIGLDGATARTLDWIGQHGVTLFFVLSGFLITSRLQLERERTQSIDLRKFYVRRFLRLMPCAWLYLAFLASFHLLKSQEAVSCIFFFRNFIELGDLHRLTQHFWSLSIEEQFYLVWPAVLLCCGARASRWLALAAASGFAAWRFFMIIHHHIAFGAGLATQYHADALLLGCAAALFQPRATPHPRSAGWFALLFVAAILPCFVLFNQFVPFAESAVIALAIRGSIHVRVPLVSSLLAAPALTLLGIESYSIYIWQQPVAHYESARLPDVALKLVIVLALATLSYYVVERPMIRLGERLTRSRRGMALSLETSAPQIVKGVAD
jgi:peptidoglycan/LPS O-acetylase OafA/YrhL